MLKFEDFQDLCFTVNIRYKNEGENPGITSEMAWRPKTAHVRCIEGLQVHKNRKRKKPIRR